MLEISYGHLIADWGDEYVALADKALFGVSQSGTLALLWSTTFHCVSAAIPDFTYLIMIVRYAPSFLPGASFKRKAKIWKRMALEMLNKPYEMVNKRIVSYILHVQVVSE